MVEGMIKVPLADIYSHCSNRAELVTQAVFATEVVILKEKERWYQIQIPVQQNYSGWVEKKAVILGKPSELPLGKIVVQSHRAGLKNAPAKNAEKIMDLFINTRLWVLRKQQNWYEVWLPGGKSAWLQGGDAFSEHNPFPGNRIRGEHLLNIARSFLGIPYLWGGLTPKGIDCSGLVYTIYALCGFYLHRDADWQYLYDGSPVNLEKICPGDLIFFYGDIVEKPTHVGIYEADQYFINASSKQNGVVRYNLLENNWRFKISGVKRILTG